MSIYTEDTIVKIAHYHYATNELLNIEETKIQAHTGIPAFSTTILPNGNKKGYALVFNQKKQQWEYVEDHRYEDVYNIHTKQKEEISYIGALKDEHTLLEPPSFYHDFIDGKWIITAEKQAEIDEVKTQQRISELEAEKAKLSADMQMHLLLDEKDEATAIALKIKEINSEIEQLKE